MRKIAAKDEKALKKFRLWWKQTQWNRMSHSRYLALKAWMEAWRQSNETKNNK
jgi:hypothetical protein